MGAQRPASAMGRVSSRETESQFTLTLQGELDLSNAEVIGRELRILYKEREPVGGRSVGLDLALVTYLDGSVLTVLREFRRELQSQGVTLWIFTESPVARMALEVSGARKEWHFWPHGV